MRATQHNALALTLMAAMAFWLAPAPSHCFEASEAAPGDLLLTPGDLRTADVWSHFAWGLLLQMEAQQSFDAAADHYLQALRLQPDSAVILEHLVRPYAMQRQFNRVLEMLEPLATAHPEATHLVLVCAEIMRTQNQEERALALLRNTLDAGGWSDPHVLRELLITLWRGRRLDDVAAVLAEAGRRPALRRHFVTLHGQAILYTAQRAAGQHGGSPRRLRALERAAVKSALAAVEVVEEAEWEGDVAGLAALLLEQGQAAAAAAMFARLKGSPMLESPGVVLAEAEVLHRLDRGEEALARLDWLRDYAGLNPVLQTEVARLYVERDRLDEAVLLYERVAAALPKALVVRLQLAYLYLRMGDAQKGLAVLLPIPDLPPPGLRLQAHLYRRTGRNDQAIASLKAAEAAASAAQDTAFFDLDFHLFYATVAEEMGSIDLAVDQARKALALDPENPMVCNFLGYILADHNRDLAEAEALIVKAVAAEPDNDAYLDSLAWVYFRGGRLQEAHDAMNRALRAGFGGLDPVILDHAGDICAGLRLHVLARWYWEEALQRNAPNRAAVRTKLGLPAE